MTKLYTDTLFKVESTARVPKGVDTVVTHLGPETRIKMQKPRKINGVKETHYTVRHGAQRKFYLASHTGIERIDRFMDHITDDQMYHYFSPRALGSHDE